MRKIAVSVLIALLVVTTTAGYSDKVSKSLSEGIVRLHIIAQSDSEFDQAVKLKVRDRILKEAKIYDKEDIENALGDFVRIANSVLCEEGVSYRARAEYGEFEFPTKYYDNFALPKGRYNAVRIKLGDAEGENWWCVLFPPLCMVDAATDESEALLKETFGENYELVKGGDMPVKIKFKIAEMF